MLLRNHPLMRYSGIASWPPAWTWIGGGEKKRPRGEIGILRSVARPADQPADRCFLYIDHQGSSYVGCLLIDDQAFCSQIVTLLRDCLDRPIAKIASLDLSQTSREEIPAKVSDRSVSQPPSWSQTQTSSPDAPAGMRLATTK